MRLRDNAEPVRSEGLRRDRAQPHPAESLPFERSRRGLEVRLPEGLAGSIAIVLNIRGNGLV